MLPSSVTTPVPQHLLAPPLPSPASPSVQAARDALSPHLNLPVLLTSLQTLSDTLSAAQTHTAPFTALHHRLQRISLTVTHLADRTSTTLAAFRHTATAALDNLDLVHDLLRDDLHPVAASVLTAEADAANHLRDQSRTLALQFESAASGLEEALSTAVETRAAAESRRAALAATVAQRWLHLRRARASADAASIACSEASALYDAADAREASARLKSSVLQMANVAAMVGSVVSTRSTNLGLVAVGSAAALGAAVDTQLQRAREERAVHLRQLQDARAEKLESDKEGSELQERLRSVQEEEELAGEALEALEKAVMALRTLAGVMVKAEVFWTAVGESVGGGDSVLGMIREGSEVGEEGRVALWRSGRLRERMVTVQTRWVALRSVCEDCLGELVGTRKDMYTKLVSGETGGPRTTRAGPEKLGAFSRPGIQDTASDGEEEREESMCLLENARGVSEGSDVETTVAGCSAGDEGQL